jgi:hypothetical protein
MRVVVTGHWSRSANRNKAAALPEETMPPPA